MKDFRVIDTRFDTSAWAALDIIGETDSTVKILMNFSVALDSMQKELYQDGRIALAEFDAHHNRADAAYRKCEKLQEQSTKLLEQQTAVLEVLSKFIPTSEAV
jgi:hypothetical protein